MTNHATEISQRKAAIISGFAYLIIFFVTPHAWVDRLIVAGDAATTFANLSASESLFRVGIACWLVVLVADTVVAWALYYFFKPLNRGLSLLASWFRLLFVAVFGINMLNWLNILYLLAASDYLTAFDTSQLEAQVMMYYEAYNYGANISFIFFGVHIGIIGYLVLKSDYIPQVLGVLLIIAFVGYLIDSFASFLSSGYANNEAAFWIVVALPAFISEFSLAIWLLLKGGKKTDKSGSLSAPT